MLSSPATACHHHLQLATLALAAQHDNKACSRAYRARAADPAWAPGQPQAGSDIKPVQGTLCLILLVSHFSFV